MVKKTLRLKGLEFLTSLEGMGFDDLGRSMQRQIEESQITAYIINPGTPDEVKYNLFTRLNTGGLVLTAQEIRNALHHGAPMEYIRGLAADGLFRELVNVSPSRQQDLDFVTRFIAFYVYSPEEYRPTMDVFLNNATAKLAKMPCSELGDMRHDFTGSLAACKAIFGAQAFRRASADARPATRINKALFEVLTVTLARVGEGGRSRSIKKADQVRRMLGKLMDDSEFVKAISASTGDAAKTKYRHKQVKALFEEVIGS